MEADEILKTRSLVNRNLYQQKITDAAEALAEEQQPANYVNFDASTGLARLQSTDGNIIYGAAQTNGAIGLGQSVRLRKGGVLARYDEMPTIKQQQIINVTPVEAPYSFVALLTTGDINTSVHFETNRTGKIQVGLDPRKILINYQPGGQGGDILTVSYSGFSLTTEPTSPGLPSSLEIQYAPDDSADGYLHFSYTPGTPTSGLGVDAHSNAIYYICDGKQIERLNYETAYALNGTTRFSLPSGSTGFLSFPSVVGNKIYVTLKQNCPPSTPFFYQITIFEIDLQTLQQKSMQVFHYVGEDSIILPDNQDWRKSFTLSFLLNPPNDPIGCITRYRDDPYAHLDKTQRIINAGSEYFGNLTTTKQYIFQSGKFTLKVDDYGTNFKNKTIFLKTTSQIAARSQYCTLS